MQARHSKVNVYLDEEFLVQVADREGERLIPDRVEILVHHFTFVQGLPVQFEFHIRITCAYGESNVLVTIC